MSRIPVSVKEAKEQAAEYFGFTASAFIQIDSGKVFEIPNPGLMDDDQIERYEDLQFLLESCDRDADEVIPAGSFKDDDGNAHSYPERVIKGDFKKPFRIDGALLRPPYAVRLATVLFGDEGYAEYKAGGGIAAQVALEWARMNQEFQERAASDPKSGGDGPTLEVVRSGD